MGKKVIRLSENELLKIIEESISNTLEHINFDDDDLDNDIRQFINSLSSDELNRLWFDYSKISHSANYENPLTILMFNGLNEGFIHTYPIDRTIRLDRTIRYITSYFNLNPIQIKEQQATNGVSHILVCIPTINNNLELMKKAMDFCGYYLGFPKEDSIPKDKWVWLQFEPKIQSDGSRQIKEQESVLMHLTPFYNLSKIRNIGFSPRCKNELFDYPGRVYFLRGSLSQDEIINIGQQLRAANNGEANTGRYALISVDLNRIPNEIKLHIDPNYPYGVYTTQNIAPNAIVNVSELQF